MLGHTLLGKMEFQHMDFSRGTTDTFGSVCKVESKWKWGWPPKFINVLAEEVTQNDDSGENRNFSLPIFMTQYTYGEGSVEPNLVCVRGYSNKTVGKYNLRVEPYKDTKSCSSYPYAWTQNEFYTKFAEANGHVTEKIIYFPKNAKLIDAYITSIEAVINKANTDDISIRQSVEWFVAAMAANAIPVVGPAVSAVITTYGLIDGICKTLDAAKTSKEMFNFLNSLRYLSGYTKDYYTGAATVRSAVKITQKAYGSPCLEAASFSGNTMYGALYAKGTWGRY